MCVFFRLRNMCMMKMKVSRFSGGYVMSVGLWFAMCGISKLRNIVYVGWLSGMNV
ncbi:hypothetical protein Lalb_Chr21g0314831 [Lupinus albus]|uniref:Uncharacterized protein n=1 Tax=Lupinus albus TaxID=3870 RepID=A0A6A4NQU1_LUPAL|nr:hypothetical protein Lalb_Chr21g0314831 [Lupinus albus]